MRNIEKITEETCAPLFGEKDRPADVIKGEELKSLKDEGVNFETYTIHKDETLIFPAYSDMLVKKQPVQKGSDRKVIYVACERLKNGRKSTYWFNVNSLAKRDADNNPVYPEWYDLGNVDARLHKLAEVGAITAKEEKEILVPLFEGNKRVYNDEVQTDGTVIKIGATKKQTVAMIVPAE